MSWESWSQLVPTFLVGLAVTAWWFTEPKTAHLNLIVGIGCALFAWAVAPELCAGLTLGIVRVYGRAFSWLLTASLLLGRSKGPDGHDCTDHGQPDHRCAAADHAAMAHYVTLATTATAAVWLIRRAAVTLLRPLPELVSILGVDVPDPPDVALAGIKSTSVVLTWSAPRPGRPVNKFLFQVNGVLGRFLLSL